MNCDYFNIILAIIIALIPVVTATITLTQHLQRLGGIADVSSDWFGSRFWLKRSFFKHSAPQMTGF